VVVGWVPQPVWTVGEEVSLLTLPAVSPQLLGRTAHVLVTIATTFSRLQTFHDGIKDFVCQDNNEPLQIDWRFTRGECVICIDFVDKIM
jgi:hypothetical protein